MYNAHLLYQIYKRLILRLTHKQCPFLVRVFGEKHVSTMLPSSEAGLEARGM